MRRGYKLLMRRFLFAFREFKGNIHKQNDYQNKSSRYLNTNRNIPEIVHFSKFLSHQNVTVKKIIPKVMFKINASKSCKSLGKVIFEPINAAANQAAEILIDNAEIVLSNGWYIFLFIKTILTFFKSKKVSEVLF